MGAGIEFNGGKHNQARNNTVIGFDRGIVFNNEEESLAIGNTVFTSAMIARAQEIYGTNVIDVINAASASKEPQAVQAMNEAIENPAESGNAWGQLISKFGNHKGTKIGNFIVKAGLSGVLSGVAAMATKSYLASKGIDFDFYE